MLINFKYHWCIISSVVLFTLSLSCEKRQNDQNNTRCKETEQESGYEIDNYGINDNFNIYIIDPFCSQAYGSIEVELNTSEYTFQWEHTDSMTNRLYNLKAGQYNVTITDTTGNYAAITINMFNTFNSCLCHIPRTFTPNNDGINDFWEIRELRDYYPNCKVTIFNKQGNTLFVSTGYHYPWDGNYKGHPLEEGDYYYTLDLYNDGSEVIEGVVTIMR